MQKQANKLFLVRDDEGISANLLHCYASVRFRDCDEQSIKIIFARGVTTSFTLGTSARRCERCRESRAVEVHSDDPPSGRCTRGHSALMMIHVIVDTTSRTMGSARKNKAERASTARRILAGAPTNLRNTKSSRFSKARSNLRMSFWISNWCAMPLSDVFNPVVGHRLTMSPTFNEFNPLASLCACSSYCDIINYSSQNVIINFCFDSVATWVS